jgi:hypothetical protein
MSDMEEKSVFFLRGELMVKHFDNQTLLVDLLTIVVFQRHFAQCRFPPSLYLPFTFLDAFGKRNINFNDLCTPIKKP